MVGAQMRVGLADLFQAVTGSCTHIRVRVRILQHPAQRLYGGLPYRRVKQGQFLAQIVVFVVQQGKQRVYGSLCRRAHQGQNAHSVQARPRPGVVMIGMIQVEVFLIRLVEGYGGQAGYGLLRIGFGQHSGDFGVFRACGLVVHIAHQQQAVVGGGQIVLRQGRFDLAGGANSGLTCGFAALLALRLGFGRRFRRGL